MSKDIQQGGIVRQDGSKEVGKTEIEDRFGPTPFRYTATDMRRAFQQGASFEREHQFMPPEVRPMKAIEEALARWQD